MQKSRKSEILTSPSFLKHRGGKSRLPNLGWKNHITGYIEAKDPSTTNLDYIEGTEQLKRYVATFPNVILTNFYEFRLYRDGQRIGGVMIGRPVIAQKLQMAPPLENIERFQELFDLFFHFLFPRCKPHDLLQSN